MHLLILNVFVGCDKFAQANVGTPFLPPSGLNARWLSTACPPLNQYVAVFLPLRSKELVVMHQVVFSDQFILTFLEYSQSFFLF